MEPLFELSAAWQDVVQVLAETVLWLLILLGILWGLGSILSGPPNHRLDE